MSDKKKAVVEKLETVRGDLLDLIGGVNEEAWSKPVFSESAEWQVSDLLRHVVSAEHGMTGLIENIRDGGSGTPPEIDLTRWNASRVRKTKDKSIATLTAELAQNRAYLLTLIDNLSEADLAKKGRHISGHIMTIEQILHRIADHENEHTDDMKKALEG